jgi:amidase
MLSAIGLHGSTHGKGRSGTENLMELQDQIVGSRYREDLCLDAAEAIKREAGALVRQSLER